MNYILTVAALATACSLQAESLTDKALRDLPEPPEDARAGAVSNGVQIGVWSQKSTYSGEEIRNIWTIARKTRPSPITIGVGGNLYKDSFLYVTMNNKVIAKLPVNGGIDGMVDPIHSAGGRWQQLAKLPTGDYQLQWKTDKLESNTLNIKIR